MSGLALMAAVLAACTTANSPKFSPEKFDSATTHARNYATAPAYTCEAARRALLSQGFVMTVADANHVDGKKNFQPLADEHIEIEFQVVCAPDGKAGEKTIAFATALQDRFALKKSSNSASVGVGPIGSLSLPFSSSDDSLVRVGSETINSSSFYDSFFALLKRYLDADAERQAPPVVSSTVIMPPLTLTPKAAPAMAAPPAASAPESSLIPPATPVSMPASAPAG
jgi:Uncharacterized protein conserved in bacteria (DUF2242)